MNAKESQFEVKNIALCASYFYCIWNLLDGYNDTLYSIVEGKVPAEGIPCLLSLVLSNMASLNTCVLDIARELASETTGQPRTEERGRA